MKLHRCILCLVITLMSVLHCSCQSSEERTLGNEVNYPELDHSKSRLGDLNGLLESLARTGGSDSGRSGMGSTDTGVVGAPVDPIQYDTAETIAARLGYARLNDDIKRSWTKMNAAWGKRVSNGGRNSGWTRFGGAWGKREPGWNNLKGLWGKRAEKWSKLASAWGKRQEMSRVY